MAGQALLCLAGPARSRDRRIGGRGAEKRFVDEQAAVE